MVVLLIGLDSSAVGIKALSDAANTPWGPLIEYLLTRRQMLGEPAPD
jgi:hypothetical protein